MFRRIIIIKFTDKYRSKNKGNTQRLEIKLQESCKKFSLLKLHKLYNIGKTFTIMCRLHLCTQHFVYLDDIVRLLHFFLRFRYCIFDRPIDKRFHKTFFIENRSDGGKCSFETFIVRKPYSCNVLTFSKRVAILLKYTIHCTSQFT